MSNVSIRTVRFGGAPIASAALLIASRAAAAGGEPICADRPGKATGTCMVPAGMVQVETGLFIWARERSASVRTDELTIGETALKLGLADRLHVEFVVSPYTRVQVRDGGVHESSSGFGDIGLRAKYRVTSDGAPVQLAVSPFVKIPTAKRSFGNGKVEGGIAVPVEWSVPGSLLSLTLTPEVDINADNDGSGRHLGMVQAVSLGAELSSRFSVAADLWGSWDFDPAGTVRHYSIGPSAAYLLSNNLQIDAGVDFGLNRDTPGVEIYSGFAVRF